MGKRFFLQAFLSVLISGSVAASFYLRLPKRELHPTLPAPPTTVTAQVFDPEIPQEFPFEPVPIAHAEARASRARKPTYQHGSAVFHTLPLTERVWKGLEEERLMLLRRSITLEFPSFPGLEQKKWHLTLVEHPEWIQIKWEGNAAHAVLDTRAISQFLGEVIAAALPPPTHAHITQLPTEGAFTANVSGQASDGWELPVEEAAAQVTSFLMSGAPTLVLPVRKAEGRIINETPFNLGSLTLLGKGRSNFAGSPPNRVFNVEKALREHINNILIYPGTEFSFNATVGTVNTTTGWKLALGIFNGKDLDYTPGGGICQSSTTLYRSVLQAGLPVTDQRNHSLYVTYYGKHGEGLDATIYPGTQDFSFFNDTGHPILLQARTEGSDAIVEIYGTPDGRSIALEGPYRWFDAPEDLTHPSGRDLYKNEIAWKQRILRNDGTLEEKILVSRYQNSIPLKKPAEASLL